MVILYHERRPLVLTDLSGCPRKPLFAQKTAEVALVHARRTSIDVSGRRWCDLSESRATGSSSKPTPRRFEAL